MRMELILARLLELRPDVLLFQEVTWDMLRVLKACLPLPGWKLHRHPNPPLDYFNATACRQHRSRGKCTANRLDSEQGRHYVIVRQDGWALVNVHAESSVWAKACECRDK